MTTMLLKNLIDNLNSKIGNLKIRKISADSRKIKKGDLFVSIKGNKFDGNKFIDQAILKGAKVVIYSGSLKKKNKNITFIKTKNTREKLAEISSKYFKKKPKNIIAVTGTNGKTSVSEFFHQIFTLNNKPVGVLGTLGLKINNNYRKRKLTTLDPLSLHKDLEEMKKSKIDNVIIEASSHGLVQKRLDFLNIKSGIFTNLSHDHLDYHKNMQNYFSAKLILFKKLIKKKSIIITDSEIKEYQVFKRLQKKRNLTLQSIGNYGNTFKILNHRILNNYQLIKISHNKKIHNFKLNLIGSIQIKNLFMAILACKICGLNFQSIFKVINKIRSVNGRLEFIRCLPNQSKIFLDYAHTPEALKNAITSLEEHFNKKITVVFGCGGERDIPKRAKMGKIVNKLCDKIIVTDDNPRNEKPHKIRSQIIKGIDKNKVIEIPGRKKAINFALKNADPYEIILIAGKGHENYQHLGKKEIFFSDKIIIKKFKSGKISNENNKFKYNDFIIKKILKNKKENSFIGVSINSKTIKKNNLFIAIKGKNKDGHNYLNQAISKGAKYCVVSKKVKKKFKPIKVKNTFDFLKTLSKKKREFSSAKFVAITGSAGKTSLKTMLGNLLQLYSKTYFSPKSYNNHYGVPLSLSNIEPNHNFGVFEVGMNKFNEINRLSSILKPDVGIITNISEAHLENFRNIYDIAKAKSEIIQNIKKGGLIVLNRDDKFFNFHKKIANKKNIRIKSFGYSKNADFRFLKINKINNNLYLYASLDGERISLPINNSNKNYIMNILCCLAVLFDFNLNVKNIKNFFKNQKPLKGRGKIKKVKKFGKTFFLIDESYNANPLSVKIAIENFSNIRKNGKKKYFFFGDMMELGNKSHIYHKKVTNFINKSDIDKTFVYGKRASKAYKFINKNKRGEVISNLEKFDRAISKILKDGDYLMIKGSNATNLHKVSDNYLKDQQNAI